MVNNPLKDSILNEERFTITWELIPGRGAWQDQQEKIFEGAEQVADGEIVDGITLTENPGGNPAISAEYLGIKLKKMGVEPLVHFTVKDKNRNQLESFLYSMEREEVHNLLVMTGDYQVSGYGGQSKPVFDLDPVQLLDLISSLNEGLSYKDPFGRSQSLEQTHFFPGVAVSPFKKLEEELIPQYWKLEKKVEKGAKFIIPQVGYDARKFHELIQYVEDKGLDVPIIGNLYVLDYGSARAMNAKRIPGAFVSDDLMEQIAQEKKSDDKGKQARLDRAAKMYAFMKGMGFAGVHIGGHTVGYEEVRYIVEKGEDLVPKWKDLVNEFDYPMEDGFYYYKRDPESGLNKRTRRDVDRRPLKKLHYAVFEFMHSIVFEPKGVFFRPMRWISRVVDGSLLERPFQFMEKLAKTCTNDCQECGNCAISDLGYLCPMSQCPKNQRNGPCGGGYDGYCEVYPDEEECIYVRAYRRLKANKKQRKLRELYLPPPDWNLYHTSSWLNYFMGRDYVSEREGVEPPKKKD